MPELLLLYIGDRQNHLSLLITLNVIVSSELN